MLCHFDSFDSGTYFLISLEIRERKIHNKKTISGNYKAHFGGKSMKRKGTESVSIQAEESVESSV